jgi:hypothetical protein
MKHRVSLKILPFYIKCEVWVINVFKYFENKNLNIKIGHLGNKNNKKMLCKQIDKVQVKWLWLDKYLEIN